MRYNRIFRTYRCSNSRARAHFFSIPQPVFSNRIQELPAQDTFAWYAKAKMYNRPKLATAFLKASRNANIRNVPRETFVTLSGVETYDIVS